MAAAQTDMPRTAEEWLKGCQRDQPTISWCYGFMVGVHEGMAVWHQYSPGSFAYGGCPPVEASNDELFAVTRKYIQKRPEIWHKLAIYAILAAWCDAYPCNDPLK
jgi:hypothetical protein